MNWLLAHLVGDYLLQNDWMAQKKTQNWWPACLHALTYSIFFLLIANIFAVAVIFFTHLLIDRFRLIKYVLRLKEWRWKTEWGYITTKEESEEYQTDIKPPWMWVWLMIIADNTLHLTINYLSIKYVSLEVILNFF